jgi:heptaprenylglyceryl phosphate synthase
VKAIKPDKFQVLAIGKWTQIYLKLKFIYNDYSSTYEDLVEKFKLPSLKIRRTGTIAIETFKIIIKQSPV